MPACYGSMLMDNFDLNTPQHEGMRVMGCEGWEGVGAVGVGRKKATADAVAKALGVWSATASLNRDFSICVAGADRC